MYRYQDDLIEEFCKKISDNIGTELSDALTPNFSTSTKTQLLLEKFQLWQPLKNILIIA